MTKKAIIVLRVDNATKDRFQAAADKLGKSLTSFMLEAADKAAGKGGTMIATARLEKPRGKGACPTWFLARCHEAQQGGTGGYSAAGYTLAGNLPSMVSWDMEEEQWAKELERLGELLAPLNHNRPWGPDDDAAVWSWLQQHLPRCTALVPTRRRQQFLSGIYRAYEDESIGLEL